MAGGRGTRFWPSSRRSHPKQFITWGSSPSLFRQTLQRLQPLLGYEDVVVVCPGDYESTVLAQAPELSGDQLVIEPMARNTAACLALAAWHLEQSAPGTVMAVLPADHLIGNVEAFHRALRDAAVAAEAGWLVTFGLTPTFPATGYGYLERGEGLGLATDNLFRVARFSEKPDEATAQRFVDGGRHFWNSGMFVWRSDTFLEALRAHMPELFATLTSLDWQHAGSEAQREVFSRLESISVDYGVMERADQVAMVACELDWSDVGSWDAAAELHLGHTADQLIAVDSSECLVQLPKGKTAALVGVNDLVVVDTGDALLICRRGKSQLLREVVEQLEKAEREDVL